VLAIDISYLICSNFVARNDKPIGWLHGAIAAPPMSVEAKREAGYLLRQLQQGAMLSLPISRPMPSIGPRCHELRITDENRIWRIVHRIDFDAILILDVFQKTTQKTPKAVIERCQDRLSAYDRTKGKS
jgi:phage-related protein